MKKELIEQILEKLENELHIEKNSDLFEKLMYKYGLYDGMKLILEGTKNINLKETSKEV